MANYSVYYHIEADPNHREWPIGPMPSRQMALDHFNSGDARKDGLGKFGFETTLAGTDYYLIEQMNWRREEFRIYKVGS